LDEESEMSRQYDAKQHVLKNYPDDKYAGVNLFLDYLDIGLDDFEYEEGMPAEEYIYGKPVPPSSDSKTQKP
jgi:hypothetical protein